MFGKRFGKGQFGSAELQNAKGQCRPKALEPQPAGIPASIKDDRLWCVWRYVKKPEDRTWQKIPRQIDDRGFARLKDASSLVTFPEAYDAFKNPRYEPFDGVAYFLSQQDDKCCLDLDSCITEDRKLSQWAFEIVKNAWSYAESSPSNLGIKILCRGVTPKHINCRKSYRLPKFAAASTAKSSECLVIREGMVTLTGHRLTRVPEVIEEVPRLLQLCEQFDSELTKVHSNSVPTNSSPHLAANRTRLPPRNANEAAWRLGRCDMPDQISDGSRLLFSLICFMIEKWDFDDEAIVETLHVYHQERTLWMLQGGDSAAVIEQRTAQARQHLACKGQSSRRP